MSRLERLYRLLMLAFPAKYRCDRQEEIIATLLDASDQTRTRSTLREVSDLLRAAVLVRWRLATRGSIRATWVQGLRWGALAWLFYVAARVAVQSSFLAPLWVGSLLLTVTGARRWAKGTLVLALVAQALNGMREAASYGGTPNWAFTLTFFAPMSLPLLPLLFTPSHAVARGRRNLVAAFLTGTGIALLVALTDLHHDPPMFRILVGLLALAAGWIDPRVAIAAGVSTINAALFQVLSDAGHGQYYATAAFAPAMFFGFALVASYRTSRALKMI